MRKLIFNMFRSDPWNHFCPSRFWNPSKVSKIPLYLGKKNRYGSISQRLMTFDYQIWIEMFFFISNPYDQWSIFEIYASQQMPYTIFLMKYYQILKSRLVKSDVILHANQIKKISWLPWKFCEWSSTSLIPRRCHLQTSKVCIWMY